MAITPRSFANGLYFTGFRREFTEAASFRRVILFDRRDRVFSSSSVLQETVIFSALKSAPSEADLVRVETWPDQATMKKYLADISWETEVWTSDHPTHLVHFNGERFLGPYND